MEGRVIRRSLIDLRTRSAYEIEGIYQPVRGAAERFAAAAAKHGAPASTLQPGETIEVSESLAGLKHAV